MIFIDVREDKKVFKAFEKLNLQYEKKQLLVGDVIIEEKNVCIERKTAIDFAQSSKGHLQEQLIQMQNNFEKCYLIIEGNFKDLFWNSYTKHFCINNWLGVLSSILAKPKYSNVKICFVDNTNQFAKLIEMMIKKFDDDKFDILELNRIKFSKTKDVRFNMLCCIPGISRVTVKNILDVYNLEDLFHVNEEELLDIEGIGKKRAQQIIDIFQSL